MDQRDILANGDIDVYICHCGSSSIYEALYYGVPMIMIPQQLDQFANAKLMKELGIGLIVEHGNKSGLELEEHIKDTFQEIFSDYAVFKKNIMELRKN